MDYLYVFQCAEFYKIGVSRDPKARLKEMQPHCPLPIVAVGFCQMERKKSVAIEQAIHLVLRHHWKHGEWFQATIDEVHDALQKAKTFIAEVGVDLAHRKAHSRRFIKTELRLSV